MNGFYSAVLTLMREQNRIPFMYLAGAVLSLILTPHFVEISHRTLTLRKHGKYVKIY